MNAHSKCQHKVHYASSGQDDTPQVYTCIVAIALNLLVPCCIKNTHVGLQYQHEGLPVLTLSPPQGQNQKYCHYHIA